MPHSFIAAVEERDAAVRAKFLDETQLAVRVAEAEQVLAE